MPKQHRWIIKRNLQQSANNIEHAISNLVTAGHEFEVVHPEHYQAFCLIVGNLYKIKLAIIELKDLI